MEQEQQVGPRNLDKETMMNETLTHNGSQIGDVAEPESNFLFFSEGFLKSFLLRINNLQEK